MQYPTTDLNKVNQLAWILSRASATDQLDVPGEYIWAFPKDDSFDHVRSRSRSIFSSGNSIKDPEVIDYIQTINISPFLLDPWIVKKFEDNFVSWTKQGTNFKLNNLELFKNIGFSAGTQESFLNYYLMNKDKRLRVFRGDYWWHMDIWEKANINWAYI
jgi:hypothetical protein